MQRREGTVPATEAAPEGGVAARVQGRAPFRATTLATIEHAARVEGRAPDWLRGALVRVAPAGFHLGSWEARHWFDGLALLYAFELSPQGVRFRQRMLTSEVAAALAVGRARHATFATPMRRGIFERLVSPVPRFTDNTNVNVVSYGGVPVALTETPHQNEIDLATLQLRARVRWTDGEGELLTGAHPQHDVARDVMVNYGLALNTPRPHVVLFEHAPSSRRRRVFARLYRKRVPYLHSFGLTPRHAIVCEPPVRFDPMRLLWSEGGLLDHLQFAPTEPMQIVRVDRASGECATHEAPAGLIFHVVNAFERRDATLLDVSLHGLDALHRLALDAIDRAREPLLSGRYVRLVLRHGSKRAEVEPLSDVVPFELPCVDRVHASGVEHARAWGASFDVQPTRPAGSVVAVETAGGRVTRFAAEDFVIGEPVFVGRPGAKVADDGVVIAVGTRRTGDESRLFVLDARTLTPLAEASVPTSVPFGFHGSFFG